MSRSPSVPVLLALGLVVCGPARAGDPSEAYEEAVARMIEVESSVRDLVYRFARQEWVSGDLSPREEARVKFRKPLDIFMEWTGTVHGGQQALLAKGQANGALRVNPPGLIPAVSIDPRGNLALKGNRHPITEVALTRTVAKIIADLELALAHPDHGCTMRPLEPAQVFGAPASCFDVHLAKEREPAYYAVRAEVCFDDRTGLPTRVRSYDVEGGALRLVEDYGFWDIQVNPGLTDLDFDTTNPAYDL